MVFAYVLIEGWIIHPYVYCFFNSSDQVLVLPPHYVEVINCGTMSSDGRMVIYWGGGLIIPQPDGSFSTTLYRKQSHIDLYLQCDSHHTIAANYSRVNTLNHRGKAACSNSQLLEKEEDHLQMVLLENKYPMWALNRVKIKIKAPSRQDQEK